MENKHCYSITIKYVGAHVLAEMCSLPHKSLPVDQTQELTLGCLCPWPDTQSRCSEKIYPCLYPFLFSKCQFAFFYISVRINPQPCSGAKKYNPLLLCIHKGLICQQLLQRMGLHEDVSPLWALFAAAAWPAWAKLLAVCADVVFWGHPASLPQQTSIVALV